MMKLNSISELTSGSITTSEFSELCKVLRINPPVNKYRKYQSKKSTSQKQDEGINKSIRLCVIFIFIMV